MLTTNQLKLIQLRREQGKSKRLKTPPKWLHPNTAEREYTRELYQLTNDLKKLIKEVLIPQLPYLVAEVQIKTPDPIKQDDFLDRLRSIILTIKQAISPKVLETILEASKIGVDIARYNQTQYQKTVKSVFGIDIFENEPWLEDQLKLFSSQNSQLIRSIPDQELEQVSQLVERGLQEGSSIKDIEKDLIERFGITRRRAKLIARDQTAKLNASLTKLRQEQLGVEEYTWQTAGDERVRPTHRANDGKKFKWSSPPSTGHPGTAINCRCVAIPVLEGILE